VIIIAVVLGLVTASVGSLYYASVIEARSLSEYLQHLLLNPESYEDQRGKFLAYLASTDSQTSTARSLGAMAALARVAGTMRPQLMLSNIASRNAAAQKSNSQAR
jgi:hypothetical protein